mmetsp:Transcript_53267/g.126781  ORF Transcript_53267/g.126781 Transcript_53267/m.126781 type:complete len:225 (-) Transcript_53267:1763-2437(-)
MLPAVRAWSRHIWMVSASLREERKSRHVFLMRRLPTASASLRKGVAGSVAAAYAASNSGRRAAAMALLVNLSAATSASGSMVSTASPRVARDGRPSETARSDGSAVVSARIAPTAFTRRSETAMSLPSWEAFVFARSVRWNSIWPASHLLKGSESLAMRNASSSSDRSISSFTGALKPRRRERTGSSVTPSNTKSCLAWLSSRTVSLMSSLPSLPSSPALTGMR